MLLKASRVLEWVLWQIGGRTWFSYSFDMQVLNCLLVSNQLGAFAVLIRQTNIIWMIFVACIGVINITLAHRRIGVKVNENHVSVRKNDFLTSTSSISVGSNLRKRKSGKAVDNTIPSTSSFSATQTSGSVSYVWLNFASFVNFETLFQFTVFALTFQALRILGC